MTVPLATMRELLLPGLVQISGRYRTILSVDWPAIFGSYKTTLAAPHIWVPKLTLPQAIAAGAAAAVITNPEVTRRFWAGWAL